MWQKDQFRASKDEVIKIIKRNLEEGRTLLNVVTEVSQNYGVPLIVTYEFVKEDMPEHKDECNLRIKHLADFYGVNYGK